MTTVVLAELPTTAPDRFRVLVADELDAAREQLQQTFGFFRLRGFAPCRDRAEAHRLASLIRSHASSTSSTGALAFTDRSLATALSALKPIAQGQELKPVPPALPCQKPFGDELAELHADGPLLWAKAQLAAFDHITAAQGFNRELRIELGVQTLKRLRADLLDGDDDALRPARIAFVQQVKPEQLPDELRNKTTAELQNEPFQPAPEPVVTPAPVAPAPQPPAAKKPAAPAPATKPAGGLSFGNYLVSLWVAAFIGACATIPGMLAGGTVSLLAQPLVCSSSPNEQARCREEVANGWMQGGLLVGAFVGFTGALYLFGSTAGMKENKA